MKKAKSIRNGARRRLDNLIFSQNSKCYYCGSFIVRLAELVRRFGNNNVSVLRYMAIWRENEKVIVANIASVEHLKNIRDGGDNSRENLVASCIRCNRNR